MTNFQKISLFLLRLTLGILFFSAGYEKLINLNWSAAGYIAGSKAFSGFYHWFLNPNVLPTVNFLNEWGLTLIGSALILGIFVRPAAFFGLIMMILYYFPAYSPDRDIIDTHIIYAAAFLVLMSFGAGNILTLNSWIQTRLHPMWHRFID